MNETLQVILSRRSIRKYKPEQIMDSELQQILKAAVYAPSAMNRQKWHFSIIQDQELLDQMVDVIKEQMLNSGQEHLAQRARSANFHTFYHAPTLIIICRDEKASYIDCGAAAQNIALAAESLNIGSCLIGFTAMLFAAEKGQALLEKLNIPAGYKFACSVTLGYKAVENQKAPERNMDVFSFVK